MFLVAVMYGGFQLFLSAVIGLNRAFIYTSFLPLLIFTLPLMQFLAASMSVVSLPFGVTAIIRARRMSVPIRSLGIAVTLSVLPLILLLILFSLNRVV